MTEDTNFRSRPTRAWRAVTLLLVLAIVVAGAWQLVREPETKIVEVPSSQSSDPAPEMLARLAAIEAELSELSAESQNILRRIAAYECPPGTEPDDIARLAAIKARAATMLVARRAN